MLRRVALALVAISGIALPLALPAQAQPYPTKPVHLIIPQPPGGHSDVLGRIIAERFVEILKQPVVVENRGGAGGTIAAETVARAAADGQTLLFAGSNNLTLASILRKDLRYGVRDFAPVGTIARVSYGLAVHPRLPVRTIAELVDYARAHPGELNYASTGMASTSNVIFELLKGAAAIDIVHIPFKGSASAVNELLGGRIDMMFNDLGALMPLAQRGSVRLIAVAGLARSARAPEVATVTEQGYAELAIEPWYGIFVPAGTPPDIVALLNGALRQALRTPEIVKRFDQLGFTAIETTPEELQDMIRAELRTFGALIEKSAIDPER